jgi:hypothetical protein
MPSTVIRRFEYDEPTRTLTVTFVSGDLYAYRDVPPEVAESFRSAFSKGRFFAAYIRDRYDCECLKRRGDIPLDAPDLFRSRTP